MKSFGTLAVIAATALFTSMPAVADTYVQGTVEEINAETGRLTINHGPLVDLDMEAMTMIFRLAEPTMLDGLAVGDTIEFVAGRVNGRLTVMALRTE